MIALLFLTTVCPGGAVTMGVDVSQFQGTVDWSMVHGAGAALLPEVADQPPIDAPRRDAPASDANGGNGAASDSGCSCSTSRAQSPPILLLLVLVSGWRLRRAAIRSRRR